MLPVEDAFKYEKDLPNCVGVTLIPDAQHAPALENPASSRTPSSSSPRRRPGRRRPSPRERRATRRLRRGCSIYASATLLCVLVVVLLPCAWVRCAWCFSARVRVSCF